MFDTIASCRAMMQRWWNPSNYDGITSHKNALHLIQLRWIAVVGQITTIVFVNQVLRIPTPTAAMLGFVIFLIAFNLASALRWHDSQHVARGELFIALLVDVFTLTAQLYLSGGTQDPFAFLYLMQIVICAVLLDSVSTWCIVIIASACLYGLSLHAVPLRIPPDLDAGEITTAGIVICFVLNATLSTLFITRINQNLRARQAQVATLRQREVEEDHIVRMGLLASGAAHELGTPLATMSVLLGDWQHMPKLQQDAELQSDLREMQVQLARCKHIISGILSSAGEMRSDSSAMTTARGFLDALVAEWQTARSVEQFEFDNRLEADFQMAFGTALKQMLCNVLDNAAEASPRWLRFSVVRSDDMLTFEVTDSGPGFAAEILDQVGKPYRSTKGGSGRGLGLFFVVNLARKLGGTVAAQNRSDASGAIVRIALPLSTICLDFRQEAGNDV